jgi:hypothetical protein
MEPSPNERKQGREQGEKSKVVKAEEQCETPANGILM